MGLRNIYKLGKMTIYKEYKKQEMKEHPLCDLFWETTLSCNAKCKHCGSSAEGKKYDGELTTGEIKHALKQIAHDMDATKILINVTGGEPLVRQDVFEVMEYATNELGFHWGMTTNGILLTPENIEKLKKANLETISISIDGLRETHDKFRGVPGSYDKIVSNIKALREAGFVKHIQVTTVFHKENINQIEELHEVMKGLELDSWRTVSMDPIGRANENSDLMLDASEFKRLLDFVKKHSKDKKMPVKTGCQGFLGMNYEGETRESFFNCRTGVTVGTILYNGDIFVCPNVPRVPELIQGNVRNDRFTEVWNNKFEFFRNENRFENEECKKCEYWDFCQGGSAHTFDYENKVQNKCPYKMFKDLK